MASFNCGIEALILGSLITLASGDFTISPKLLNASSTTCSLLRNSGNTERIRAAREMSLVSIDMP